MNHRLGKNVHTIESSILANADILVGVVRRDTIGDHSHGYRDLLARAKTKQHDRDPPAGLKKSAIRLASLNYLHE
jgi:hypothetical protein